MRNCTDLVLCIHQSNLEVPDNTVVEENLTTFCTYLLGTKASNSNIAIKFLLNTECDTTPTHVAKVVTEIPNMPTNQAYKCEHLHQFMRKSYAATQATLVYNSLNPWWP